MSMNQEELAEKLELLCQNQEELAEKLEPQVTVEVKDFEHVRVGFIGWVPNHSGVPANLYADALCDTQVAAASAVGVGLGGGGDKVWSIMIREFLDEDSGQFDYEVGLDAGVGDSSRLAFELQGHPCSKQEAMDQARKIAVFLDGVTREAVKRAGGEEDLTVVGLLQSVFTDTVKDHTGADFMALGFL